MNIKKLATKLSIIMSAGVLISTYANPSVLAFSSLNSSHTTNGITVDIKQIKDLVEGTNKFGNDPGNQSGNPTQNLAYTAASLVTSDDDRENLYDVTGDEVLSYLYPNDTPEQLKNEKVTAEQTQSWLKSRGYTSSIVDRPLTVSEIKENLDQSEPAIVVLEGQNKEDWINSQTSGVIYAHDDITGIPDELHSTFIKTINYGEYIMNDGTEGETFTFPSMQDNPDEIQRSNSFKWTRTITDIKKDPSWHVESDIQGDRIEGTFNVSLTNEGTNVVGAKFTDSDVTSFPKKYAKDNAAPGVKLSAISLINLYFDKDHQKTVDDIDRYFNISEGDEVTGEQVQEWYKWLGFSFDTLKGKITKDITKSTNSAGKLYLSFFKKNVATDDAPMNMAVIGMGFTEDAEAGYNPVWNSAKTGEGMSVGYNLDMSDPTTAVSKFKAAKKAFNYDSIIKTSGDSTETPGASVYYDADITLYNIKYNVKDSVSSKTQGTDSSPDISYKSASAATTGFSPEYITTPDFKIRETQGTEPWCAEYVAAAAINTVYKAKDTSQLGDGAITTAQTLMQNYFPGTSDDQLATMGGGTVQHSLEVIKNKYSVTADFEKRQLTFEEVKAQIDNDKIIEIDADSVDNNTGTVNVDGDEGHALAIVGYVTPSDGNTAEHDPYYEVWNPWWQKTFYLSSKSDTILLGGETYKWDRTWYNWQKVASDVKVNIDPQLGKLKVASTNNSDSLINMDSSNNKLSLANQVAFPSTKTTTNLSVEDLNNLIPDYNNTYVAQHGNDVETFKSTHGVRYGISLSDNKKKMLAWRNEATVSGSYGDNAKNYRDTIIQMQKLNSTIILYGLGTAVIIAAMAVAGAVVSVAVLAELLASMSGVVIGGGVEVGDFTLAATDIIKLNTAQKQADEYFSKL